MYLSTELNIPFRSVCLVTKSFFFKQDKDVLMAQVFECQMLRIFYVFDDEWILCMM
jgi:hypothetical protein